MHLARSPAVLPGLAGRQRPVSTAAHLPQLCSTPSPCCCSCRPLQPEPCANPLCKRCERGPAVCDECFLTTGTPGTAGFATVFLNRFGVCAKCALVGCEACSRDGQCASCACGYYKAGGGQCLKEVRLMGSGAEGAGLRAPRAGMRSTLPLGTQMAWCAAGAPVGRHHSQHPSTPAHHAAAVPAPPHSLPAGALHRGKLRRLQRRWLLQVVQQRLQAERRAVHRGGEWGRRLLPACLLAVWLTEPAVWQCRRAPAQYPTCSKGHIKRSCSPSIAWTSPPAACHVPRCHCRCRAPAMSPIASSAPSAPTSARSARPATGSTPSTTAACAGCDATVDTPLVSVTPRCCNPTRLVFTALPFFFQISPHWAAAMPCHPASLPSSAVALHAACRAVPPPHSNPLVWIASPSTLPPPVPGGFLPLALPVVWPLYF